MYSQNNKEDADQTFPQDRVTIGYKLHRKLNSDTTFTTEKDPTGYASQYNM